MMCGIDQAIQYVKEDCNSFPWAELVINRLDYHRNQATGAEPKRNKGMSISDYYTCGNCGRRLEISDNYCSGCGFNIKWASVRCLTGLPLVDAVERKQEKEKNRKE